MKIRFVSATGNATRINWWESDSINDVLLRDVAVYIHRVFPMDCRDRQFNRIEKALYEDGHIAVHEGENVLDAVNRLYPTI